MMMYSQALVSLFFIQQVSADIKGYYMWSWAGLSTGPNDSTDAVYFSGFNDYDTAINQMSKNPMYTMRGGRRDDRNVWFTFGGGNAKGELSVENINDFTKKIKDVKRNGFYGVMWDIEWVRGKAGSCAKDTRGSIREALRKAFAKVKKAGLDNAITVSHTAPYKTGVDKETGREYISPKDQVDLMKALLKDSNVDIISPQLYTRGDETDPDFAATGSCASTCGWDLYKHMHDGMKFVPSIVNPSHYEATKEGFEDINKNLNLDLKCSGYFVWEQSNPRRMDMILV
jgi:chitinase